MRWRLTGSCLCYVYEPTLAVKDIYFLIHCIRALGPSYGDSYSLDVECSSTACVVEDVVGVSLVLSKATEAETNKASTSESRERLEWALWVRGLRY